MTCKNILIAILFLAMSAGGGCRKQEDSAKKELIVLCGSSFVPPAEELIRRFKEETGVEVATTSAGSEDFLPLVKTGQKGDILITHDPFLDEVQQAGALLDSAEVGFVAPVLAVAKGNPKGVKSIEDLTMEGLRVALSNPQYSTCGEMVFDLLGKKGIKGAVLVNVGNRLTKGHGNLGTLLQTGAVDAAILWNGVAHNYLEHIEIVPTPYEYDATIRAHVIGLKYSKNPDLVREFITFAQKHGPEIFASFGYVKGE
ncbi:MAG: extracellular solute-binding protein [Phycisphaerales bacterium]|nr:extracellular solute-binding protein [Phycisphaerales bacterium]